MNVSLIDQRRRDYKHAALRAAGYQAAELDRFATGLHGMVGSVVGYGFGTTVSAYNAIRGREQQLYDYYKENNVILGNIDRPVDRNNPFRYLYDLSSTALFGPVMGP